MKLKLTQAASLSFLLVEPTVQTTWGSCLTIMPNLVASYEKMAGGPIRKIDFGRHSTVVSTLKAAQEIFAAAPDVLVFIDHLKHPYELLKALDFVYGRRPWPKLIIHVYGDFTLHTNSWKKSEALLVGRSVQFVTASPRQNDLISLFTKTPQGIVSVCPFPVSDTEYSFTEGLRERERTARNYATDEFVMTYTGRLSLQKNIIKMIWEVAHAADKLKRPWRLQLAGAFDDLGSPFFSLQLRPNSYAEGVTKLVNSLPESFRQRIEFLGSLDKVQLRALYHASDLFVSLSTHHDEDYGMSPIEALCCGCRVLISDWGGFHGFGVDPLSTSFVPVSLRGRGPHLHTELLSEQLERLSYEVETEDRRRERAEFYLENFGIAKVAAILAKVSGSMKTRFAGFSPALKRHAKLMTNYRTTQSLFRTGARVDPNYREFYETYIAPERRR